MTKKDYSKYTKEELEQELIDLLQAAIDRGRKFFLRELNTKLLQLITIKGEQSK